MPAAPAELGIIEVFNPELGDADKVNGKGDIPVPRPV
jgi:hypothetical protein